VRCVGFSAVSRQWIYQYRSRHAREFAKLAKPFTQAELAEKLTNIHPMPGKARVLTFQRASPKN
jgi:hypothetical protein